MLTGRHMVRDVMCKNCGAKLGWMYEFATEESQKWVKAGGKSEVRDSRSSGIRLEFVVRRFYRQ